MSEGNFYSRAAKYWSQVPATIDGVLGGFGHISDIDISGSKAFLNEILASDNSPATKIALDCGAGIGRVSKYVLIPRFERVDLVEQDDKFIDTIRKFIGIEHENKIGSLYKIGIQNFMPQRSYDVIWCQWVLGHVKDFDLIIFLERCRNALNERGVIIVKDNITTNDKLEYDEDDSSVTRPLQLMEKIFEEAKLKVIKTEVQEGFPDDINPVYSFALTKMDDWNNTAM